MVIKQLLLLLWTWLVTATALPAHSLADNEKISPETFEELEELARIVDISYCVGTSGIQKPFKCLSRCGDFEGFELITTWNTGPRLSDSCGYIALSHAPFAKRVIVAFRGTYSIANTIADLSTNPAEYAPFPSDHDRDGVCTAVEAPETEHQPLLPQLVKQTQKRDVLAQCLNCTVHSGFMTSWRNTRCTIVPHVEKALNEYPDYELVLVGHSLGGAVAALAGLEFLARGWNPRVTTFGEPRVGNQALNEFINRRFNLNSTDWGKSMYRRVTHVDDPVPLLPLEEWGYTMHAGEIFISKPSLPPSRSDIWHCSGDEDPTCISDGNPTASTREIQDELAEASEEEEHDTSQIKAMWGIGRRYKLWELFFAHRDYFWRLGLCVPGGDPWDWSRGKYNVSGMNDEL